MKVLLVSTHSRKGGAGVAASRLLEALRKEGHDAKMLVQTESYSAEGIFPFLSGRMGKWRAFAAFMAERIAFIRREKAPAVRFLFSPANAGFDISKHPLVLEADLIHLHWVNGAYISLTSLHKLLDSGKPVVWTLHDMWAFTGGCHYALDCKAYEKQCGDCSFYLKKESAGDFSHRIWKQKKEVFAGHSMHIITPSKWLADCGRSSSLLGHMQVDSIPNTVDPELFRPVNRDEACRINSLDASRKYILFGAASAGSVLKGFTFFQKAMDILYADMSGTDEVEIVIFGKLKEKEAGLFPFRTRNVAYISSPDVLRALYSAAHCFVIPSVQDNLPNTIVESMLSGTPVVGFRSGGIPEMISHKENGYLAKYKDPEDLARGIRWILEHEAYDNCAESARTSALEKYAAARVVEDHVSLYESLCRKGGHH